MTQTLTPDLCVIGGGSGGLSVAAGAVQMGASVVLIEGHRMGGDCLNYGCVPSKALIAAAKQAHTMRGGADFGITPQEPVIDYAAAMAHVHDVIAGIAPHDSVERFRGLGVQVIEGWARFTGPREIEANGQRIAARRFVIATGSSPVVPPIPGLDQTPYLTNETIWDNRELPAHLLVIGAGPIGLELAQAHRRLGARVSIVEGARALGGNDPEMTQIVLDTLRDEEIAIHEQSSISRADPCDEGVSLTLENGTRIAGSHLLVATGRRPNLERLELARAGIAYDARGIKVDAGLRTQGNRRVYAIGDAIGGLQFTHVAGYHAGLVIRSALLRLPVRVRSDHIPRVTYTDPEIAQVGLGEEEARKIHGEKVEIARFSFAENDRARAERITRGLVKAVIGPRGRIVGCTITGPHAGDLIQPWSLALASGLKISAMAGHVAAYPTLGEVSKRAAGAYYAPRLFENKRLKQIVRLLARFG